MSMWECDIEDGPKVYVARKEYVCCECRKKILPGQKYFRAEGLWDGHWDTFRQHMICLQACMFARDNFEHGVCIAFGGLMDYYHDCKDWLRDHKKDDKVKAFRGLMAKIITGDV